MLQKCKTCGTMYVHPEIMDYCPRCHATEFEAVKSKPKPKPKPESEKEEKSE